MLATTRMPMFESPQSPVLSLPSSPSTSSSDGSDSVTTPPNSVLQLNSPGKPTLATLPYAALGRSTSSVKHTVSVAPSFTAGQSHRPRPPPPLPRSPSSPLSMPREPSSPSSILVRAANPQPFFAQSSPVQFQFPFPSSSALQGEPAPPMPEPAPPPPAPRSPSSLSHSMPPSSRPSLDTSESRTSEIMKPPSPLPRRRPLATRDRRQSLQVTPVSVPTASPILGDSPPSSKPSIRDRRQSTPLLGPSIADGPSMMVCEPAPQPRTRRKSQHQVTFGRSSSSHHSSKTQSTSQHSTGDLTNELEAKVVILGAQGVGKTAIVHRATSGVFSRSLASTLGASFLTKRLTVDGCKVRLQLWDTAGQERFRSMAPLYYRGALAAILVYDITSLDSFFDVKRWLGELRRDMSPDLIIHVVGCKSDQAPALRAVDLGFARRSVATWEQEYLPYMPIETDTPQQPPPSPTRSRANTLSTRFPVFPPSASSSHLSSQGNGGGMSSSASMPAISTATSFGARVRKMSNKLVSAPPPTPPPRLAAPPVLLTAPQQSSSASSSVSELLAGIASASEAAASSTSQAGPGSGPTSEPMGRSGSRLSLSLTGGWTSSSRRSFEEEVLAAPQRSREEAELARLEDMVKRCVVQVTEASAAIDVGVDEVFIAITHRLVQRKSQIERDRILRSRDSIILTSVEPQAIRSGWCC